MGEYVTASLTLNAPRRTRDAGAFAFLDPSGASSPGFLDNEGEPPNLQGSPPNVLNPDHEARRMSKREKAATSAAPDRRESMPEGGDQIVPEGLVEMIRELRAAVSAGEDDAAIAARLMLGLDRLIERREAAAVLGSLGGQARAAKLSADRRAEIARAGAAVRGPLGA